MITLTSPGRAEVLGNHTDYNQGLVLSLAIDRHITAKSEKRADRTLVITAKDLGETWEGSLDQIKAQTEMSWVNYILGVFDRIEQVRDIKLTGLNMEVSSTVPMGAGLSSSAALEAVTLMTAFAHNQIEMSDLEMAKVCQWAEHEYSGVRCGLLDQMSVLSSKQNHLNSLDFELLTNTPITFPEEYQFVIVNSEVSHSLADGEYNERRESCEAAAAALGKSSLREVSLEYLENNRDKLAEMPYKRALHVVGETSRVRQALDFIANGDLESFGGLMFDSHQSSIDNFENSCAELDVLVEFAKNHPACLGARLSGGGFGGATINLVKREQAESYAQEIATYYETNVGKKPMTLVTSLASGAIENLEAQG